MPTAIAALTPANQTIRRQPDNNVTPNVPDVSFDELWQDKKEGLSFGDLLDIVNPLQHIPVVSTIYRMVTGDEIGVGARIAGGALFGGPLGILGAGMVAAFENISGDTVEKHVAALWDGMTGEEDGATQLASATAAPVLSAAARPETVATIAPLEIDDDVATEATALTVAMAPPLAQLPASPQPLPRPPVTVSPMTAIDRAETKSPAAPVADIGADAAAERQRIAQSIQQAQRAQAGMLLANLGADSPADRTADEKSDNLLPVNPVPHQAQPFRSNPYLLPPGAPPEMINRAMARALDRYHATLQQRNAAAPPVAPRPSAAVGR